MAKKLIKTYQTSLGFFEQPIAAPSMKACRGGVPLLINLGKGWLDPHNTRLWYGRLWNSHRTRCISAGL